MRAHAGARPENAKVLQPKEGRSRTANVCPVDPQAAAAREAREKVGVRFFTARVRGRDDFFLSHLATVEGSSIPSTVAPPMGLFARFKMESSGMFLNIDGWAKPPSLLSFTKICLMPLQL